MRGSTVKAIVPKPSGTLAEIAGGGLDWLACCCCSGCLRAPLCSSSGKSKFTLCSSGCALAGCVQRAASSVSAFEFLGATSHDFRQSGKRLGVGIGLCRSCLRDRRAAPSLSTSVSAHPASSSDKQLSLRASIQLRILRSLAGRRRMTLLAL